MLGRPRSRSRRFPRSSLAIRGLVAVSLALPLVASAVPVAGEPERTGAAPTLPVAVVAETADFATMEFADPWDYDNPDDQLTNSANGPVFPEDTDLAMAGGQLRWDETQIFFNPVWEGIGEEMSWGRMGFLHPILAQEYGQVVLRFWSAFGADVGLRWRYCEARTNGTCDGFSDKTVEAGWQTIVFNVSDKPQWTNEITSLKLFFRKRGDRPQDGNRMALDWLRVVPRADHDVVTIQASNPSNDLAATVYWDANALVDDNVSNAQGWGPVGTLEAGQSATIRIPRAHLVAGQYRFYVQAVDATTSPHSAVLTVDDLPLAIIDDPDFAGGEDFATAAFGNPWDFNGPDDVRILQNTRDVSYAGGILQATNTPTQTSGGTIGNPYLHLNMGGANIDPQRYHRLTYVTDYDGDFSLSFGPGGGMHARFLWFRATTGRQVSRELILYTDRDTYTVDLHDGGAAISDPNDTTNTPGVGWTGSPVTDIRWDPNEDPGPRRWRLDDIRLAADDEAFGSFPIRWHDEAHDPGTTVSIHLDSDRVGFTKSHTIATGLTQVAGDNLLHWFTNEAPAGNWWMWIEATDGQSTVRRYATGPVHTDGRPRIAGRGRVQTGLGLARAGFPSGATTAVLANSVNFPDALAAAPLAAALGAPLLLNPPDALDPDVASELTNLGVQDVILLGGTSAQSSAVEAGLRSRGFAVTRLAGRSRWGTAAAIADRAVTTWRATDDSAGRRAILATGIGFADALAAGPLASFGKHPVLLTLRDEVPDETLAALDDLGIEAVTIVGGTGAVSAQVAALLVERGFDVDRISGPSRYDTAAALVAAAVEAGADRRVVVVASGVAFADALAAGPAIVNQGGVVVLTDPGILVDAAADSLDAAAPARILWIAGGRKAVLDAVVDAAVARAS